MCIPKLSTQKCHSFFNAQNKPILYFLIMSSYQSEVNVEYSNDNGDSFFKIVHLNILFKDFAKRLSLTMTANS